MLDSYQERKVILAKWFGIPHGGRFEGELVNISRNSDVILKGYMELPTEENRIAHGVNN